MTNSIRETATALKNADQRVRHLRDRLNELVNKKALAEYLQRTNIDFTKIGTIGLDQYGESVITSEGVASTYIDWDGDTLGVVISWAALEDPEKALADHRRKVALEQAERAHQQAEQRESAERAEYERLKAIFEDS